MSTTEYKLSYTAAEINNKLAKVDENATSISQLSGEIENQQTTIADQAEQITEVRNDLGYGGTEYIRYYPETSYEIENGDISATGEKLDYNWVRRQRFDCPDCVKVYIPKNTHDTYGPFIVFFDSNDHVLSSVTSTEKTITSYELNIPTGTAYFYLSTTDMNFGNELYKVEQKENVIGFMQNVSKTGYEYPYLLSPPISYVTESGGIDNDGTKTDWSWTSRKKFDCGGDKKIMVTKGWHDLTTPVVAFYDAEDNFISAGYNTETQPTVATFISPENTSYFYLIVTNGRFSVDIYSREYKVIISRDSWFKGKVASALGDSNTAGGEYFHYVKEYLGIETYKNCGISGSGIIANDDAMWQDIRINSLDINSDIITFMGGTNDVYRIENVTDSDFTMANHDTTNFVGAYNVALSKIFYKYLNIDGYYSDVDYSGIERVTDFREPSTFIVMLIAPPKRFDSAEYNASEKVEKINGFVKRIAEMWGLPCVDANETRLNDCNKYAVWGANGDLLHPPYKWHKVLAKLIINKLLENEPI